MALIDVGKTRIAYDEVGKTTSGLTVVFLHDCALNRLMWEPQMEALRGSHRAVAPDMRGHGSSDIPSGLTTLEQMADDVAVLVRTLDLAPVVLVGAGMGGQVALGVAKRYPDLVRGLVLAHTRHDTPEERAGCLDLARTVASEGPASLAKVLIPRLLSGRTIEENGDLVPRVRRMIETTSAAGIVSTLAGLAAAAEPPEWTLAHPALVVSGSEEEPARVTPIAFARAQSMTIDGARALSSLENSDAFNARLVAYLADLATAEQPAADEATYDLGALVQEAA